MHCCRHPTAFACCGCVLSTNCCRLLLPHLLLLLLPPATPLLLLLPAAAAGAADCHTCCFCHCLRHLLLLLLLLPHRCCCRLRLSLCCCCVKVPDKSPAPSAPLACSPTRRLSSPPLPPAGLQGFSNNIVLAIGLLYVLARGVQESTLLTFLVRKVLGKPRSLLEVHAEGCGQQKQGEVF